MTAHTIFNIAACFLRVQATTRPTAECGETCDGMRRRFELRLGNVASGLVAFHTKRLRLMARRALRLFRFRVDTVGKPVI
jgi:hypothetical protein